MAVWINTDGYFLDSNGNVLANQSDVKNVPQHTADQWKQLIDQAWTNSGHTGAPPSNQTIMVVQNGDCQWTIAEDAGASPTATAYGGGGPDGSWLNGQFKSNPDLIHPGDIEFVSPTIVYAHSPATPGHPGTDNAGIFANQTYQNTATAADGNMDPVKASVTAYLGSFPSDPSLSLQALANTVSGPDWGGNDDEGNYGRKIILDDYFQGIKDPNDRVKEADQLKVDLGLGQWMTPTGANGAPNYADKTGLTADQQNLVTQINEAAGIS